MKKILPFLIVMLILLSCKKEIIKTPDHLIDKEKMANIMYDLSLLEAIKVENPSSLDTFNINPNDYVFKKYKIDSIQFTQSNIYYAADYKEYKKMFEKIKARLDKNKSQVESLVKIQKKKDIILKKKKEKLKRKRETDSIKKVKKELKTSKEADSIKKIKERKLSL